jgi:hypothetical protein
MQPLKIHASGRIGKAIKLQGAWCQIEAIIQPSQIVLEYDFPIPFRQLADQFSVTQHTKPGIHFLPRFRAGATNSSIVTAVFTGNSLLKSSMHPRASASCNSPTKLITPVTSNFRMVDSGTPDRAAKVFRVRLADNLRARARSPSWLASSSGKRKFIG